MDRPHRLGQANQLRRPLAFHAEPGVEAVDERVDFIRKTYLHLGGAVLAFCAIEAALLQTALQSFALRRQIARPAVAEPDPAASRTEIAAWPTETDIVSSAPGLANARA